ncbi:MAG: PSD1 domain-containing protein [Bryobacterales bacterium]|nr:PSD1 domain-containing protein [Bryobacterales bacterium]
MRPLLLLVCALGAANASDEFFESKIRPVLATRCYVCHSAKAPKVQGGLWLDTKSGVLEGGISGPAVVPGDPERSLLIKALHHSDEALKMPPGKPLAAEVIADFEHWVRIGAPDPRTGEKPKPAIPEKVRQFWSFQPPRRHEPPNTDGPVSTFIDPFLQAKMREKGLSPSPEADRASLLRRLTYDLTGLPPEWDDSQAFLADAAPDAYERAVERLLASPQYGERWGRHWLDVARYADTRDRGARFAFSYTYRDWVIRAFNEDMPYNEFVRKQLAADRMQLDDPADLAALGFITLGRSVPKGEHDMIDDRIDAVTRGLLGLTVTCARCHDHKYDPIPTQDYYSFYGVIANSEEPVEYPLVAKPAPGDPLEETYRRGMEARLAAVEEFKVKRHTELVAEYRSAEWIARYILAAQSASKFNNREIEKLSRERDYNLFVLRRWRDYLNQTREAADPVFAPWHALAAGRKPEPANPLMAAVSRAGSMEELARIYGEILARHDAEAPHADPNAEALRLVLRGEGVPANIPLSDFLQIRGPGGDANIVRALRNAVRVWQAECAYRGLTPRAMALDDTKEQKPSHVFVRGNPNDPGVAAPRRFLAVLSPDDRQPFGPGSGRLDLANAIASDTNPLTARVLVNRVWAWHFGRGLVTSPSDFGLRGDPPSHPELLDELARRFMDEGWSIKKLHRWIVLSHAYRQQSVDRAEMRAKDLENLFLWRMNRRRLDYEELRDTMLHASGRLDRAIGGLPFSPNAEPAVPRRTVYAYLDRGRLPGELTTFDFANPEAHSPVRYQTTVPQQALYLMNSPFVAEQARHIAEAASGVADLYRRILGRDPSQEEAALGRAFVGAEQPAVRPAVPAHPWQYGMAAWDGHALTGFRPFRFWEPERWQPASLLPQPEMGSPFLTAQGGSPGDSARHAVTRRWVAPADGEVRIEGKVEHKLGDRAIGDGIRAWIIHRGGAVLAERTLRNESADLVATVTVRAGETIDFLVEPRGDAENDSFTWDPAVTAADVRWQASQAFEGPRPEPLPPLAKYAQVLLQTAEFAFVD